MLEFFLLICLGAMFLFNEGSFSRFLDFIIFFAVTAVIYLIWGALHEEKNKKKQLELELEKSAEEEFQDTQTFCRIFKTKNLLEIGEKGVKTLVIHAQDNEDEDFARRLRKLQKKEFPKKDLFDLPSYLDAEWIKYVDQIIDDHITSVLIPATKDRINSHLNILSQKKLELIHTDEFGDRHFERWNEYAMNYCNTKVLPYLEENHTIGWLHRDEHEYKAQTLNEKIYELVLAVEEKSSLDYQTNMTGVDYEQYCAQKLTEDGWTVLQTKKTGDRGADLVAELNGKKLVIQCKRYSKPVGNKAVQEVYSAKGIYGADMAAVVTNNTYTQQTHQDANALKVILISNNQIEQLTSIVSNQI